jgi:hypothetical protein
MAFARIERQRSLHYFANHVLHFLRNIGCSSVQAEGMTVSFRRLGTLITSPIRGRFRSAPYQTTTLQAPLEHACLFTLASMARLGGRIYLSCNVVHIGFLFNRILFDRRITEATMSVQHFLNSMGSSQGSGDHTERFHFWRIAKSIRHKLFLQQYPRSERYQCSTSMSCFPRIAP